MKSFWILFVFPIMFSVALVLVILGQFQEMEMISKRNIELQTSLNSANGKIEYEATFMKSLEDLLERGKKEVKALEGALVDLVPQLEIKTKERDACQTEVETKTKAAASLEEAEMKTTDDLTAESEAWKKEIDALKAQLVEYRPICDYVKVDNIALELCGKKNITV